MDFFVSIGGVFTLGFSVLIFVGIVWLIWKRALLDIQSKAMAIQQQAIEAYETRITQLEDGQKNSSLEIKRLEGIIQGKDIAMRILIDSVAETDRCMNARNGCLNRVVPIVTIPNQ